MKHIDDCVMQKIGGENLLVPIGMQLKNLNGIIILNDTAAYIWELLAKERTLDELAAAVSERFDVITEIASEDVQRFLHEITKLELLKI
ncbi:MAG: PqqD family protein [Desulfobulbaceae bacterium]|nr:PqqD family protein [Desulfobulbaceae bacterium]